ncbi:MAG: hypothetical protein ACRETN_12485 [Nevskiales bacterium]
MYKYKVVEGLSAEELTARAELEICGGWKPHGGVSVSATIAPDQQKVQHIYAQAMVLDQISTS